MNERPWWLDEALTADERGLSLGGLSLTELAAAHGTPLYVYDTAFVARRVALLRAALATTGLPFRILYALKANRFRPVVSALRALGGVGIDACSPREAALSAALGFAPGEISVTASMPSDRDLAAFVAAGVHVNVDTFSSLRRYAAHAPRGAAVGLRIDPAVQAGYGNDGRLAYASSKFGFPIERVEGAAREAHDLGLVVDTLHMHLGWGMQASSLPAFHRALATLAGLARALPSVRTVDLGGGLGVRRRKEDAPLSLSDWAAAIATHLGDGGVEVVCEPGTLLLDHAGVLLVEVNTVETKGDVPWVGVDAGHNVNLNSAHYGLPVEILLVRAPLAAPVGVFHVAGNINEPNDVFARGVALPAVREGDLLALYPAGAYGSSMASDHCMRGWATEIAVAGGAVVAAGP